MVLVVVGFGFV